MKISDLIKQLEEFKEKNGDVPVVTMEEGFGGYGIHTCSGIEATGIHPFELANGGELGDVEDKDIYELIPDWDGKQESLEEMESIVCVCINSGPVIYAS